MLANFPALCLYHLITLARCFALSCSKSALCSSNSHHSPSYLLHFLSPPFRYTTNNPKQSKLQRLIYAWCNTISAPSVQPMLLIFWLKTIHCNGHVFNGISQTPTSKHPQTRKSYESQWLGSAKWRRKSRTMTFFEEWKASEAKRLKIQKSPGRINWLVALFF